MNTTRFLKSSLVGLTVLASALGAVGCGTSSPSANAPTIGGAPGASAPLKPGDATAGKVVFDQTCIACHGPDAKGVKGLGKDLVESTFAKGQSDTELLAFVQKGRDPSDPANTTHIAMPPRGGNPSITDQQIADVIAYIRTLQKK